MNDRHSSEVPTPIDPSPPASSGHFPPYDPYAPYGQQDTQAGYAGYGGTDPLFGALPGTQPAGAHDTATYGTGTYGAGAQFAGAYDTGAYDTGSLDTGSYGTGGYPVGTGGMNAYGTGAYTDGTYGGTGYDTGAYDMSTYGTGAYGIGASAAGAYGAGAHGADEAVASETFHTSGYGAGVAGYAAPEPTLRVPEVPIGTGTPYDTGATGQWDSTAWGSATLGGGSASWQAAPGDSHGELGAPFGESGTPYRQAGAPYEATSASYDESGAPYGDVVSYEEFGAYGEYGKAAYVEGVYENAGYEETTYGMGPYGEVPRQGGEARPQAESGPSRQAPGGTPDDQRGEAAEALTMTAPMVLPADLPGPRNGNAEDGTTEDGDTGNGNVADGNAKGAGAGDAPRIPSSRSASGARKGSGARGGTGSGSRSRNRRRTAKRSALLTVAVPSVAAMGVCAVAAASVSGLGGGDSEKKDTTTTQAASSVPTVQSAVANSKLDTQLAGLSAGADDFADRASRTQERIDLKARQEEERKRRAEEEARKERERPKFLLPVAQHGLSAYYGQAGVNWMSLHTGIDFPVGYGTPVMAATDGTVRTQWNSAYGNMAIVTAPDGTETWYCHLSSTKIRSGSVKAGEQIAYSGNSGNSTGPHLHFEVRPGGGSAIDPLPWLRTRGLDPS
ncbi:peptidoglycan DD-metalloendopeptidase family protein [Streptomyces sp. NPDC003077]|uniref:M23 family metallopeptidase n=1 Tax=Streptomyces sp. NPDC003077 TaxID=3154443 RepID=UPI0033AA61BB